MAASSLTNGNQRQQPIISSVIAESVAEEVVIGRFPGIADRPKAFSAYTLAVRELTHPALEQLAQAYRQACTVPFGRDAAISFLSIMLDAED